MAERLFVSVYDIEHVRMHVWELERLIEDMREQNNPMTERLQRALARFVKADMQKDRF
jgi:hypothetical protein